MFKLRRPATAAETAALIASFAVPGMDRGLGEAEVSELATLDDLGRAHTVLRVDAPRPGGDPVYTVAELAGSWSAGGGDPGRDQGPFRHWRGVADGDPQLQPELLFEPTRSTSSGFWLIDAVHRAVALYASRKAAGITTLHLRVFVLPRPLR